MSTTRVSKEYDAVILGGGPAGASAAAVLAEKGRRVVVIEREKFPRYKIGESLIPVAAKMSKLSWRRMSCWTMRTLIGPPPQVFLFRWRVSS